MLPFGLNVTKAINFCFLVILMGMVGKLIAGQHRPHSSRVNYCMFAAPFAIVSDSFYSVPANLFPSPFAWPIILFFFDFLNFAFTFSAATALAVGIRTHSCTNRRYLDENKITQSSTERCRLAQAIVAFYYFSFFIFLGQLCYSTLLLFTNGMFTPDEYSTPRSKARRRNIGAHRTPARPPMSAI